MNRKLFYLAIALALVLSACSSPQAPQPASDQPAADNPPAATSGGDQQPAASGEKVTLRFWDFQSPSFNQANQDLINKFMEENPNIEVKFESFDYDIYIQTLQTGMAAGNEADIMEIFGTWACSYADGGRLMQVPADIMTYEQAKEIYYQAPLDGYYCNDQLYGLPGEFNLENGGVLVNPTLFEAHGVNYPPKWNTWQELVDDASKLAEFDDNGNMTRAGFHYTNGDGTNFTFLAGILQQGVSYFAEDGKHFNFESPEARNTLQLMVDMAQKDKVDDPIIFNDETNALPNSFFQGNVAIGFIGTWAAGEGLANYPDTPFDYVAIPPYFGEKQAYAADSGWGKVVSVNTKHPAEAWKLVQFMTANEENALYFATTSTTIPSMKSLVETPDRLLAAMPWMKSALDLLPNGQFIGDVTDRDQLFYEIIYPAIIDAEDGNISVDDALAQINSEANTMVDAANK